MKKHFLTLLAFANLFALSSIHSMRQEPNTQIQLYEEKNYDLLSSIDKLVITNALETDDIVFFSKITNRIETHAESSNTSKLAIYDQLLSFITATKNTNFIKQHVKLCLTLYTSNQFFEKNKKISKYYCKETPYLLEFFSHLADIVNNSNLKQITAKEIINEAIETCLKDKKNKNFKNAFLSEFSENIQKISTYLLFVYFNIKDKTSEEDTLIETIKWAIKEFPTSNWNGVLYDERAFRDERAYRKEQLETYCKTCLTVGPHAPHSLFI